MATDTQRKAQDSPATTQNLSIFNSISDIFTQSLPDQISGVNFGFVQQQEGGSDGLQIVFDKNTGMANFQIPLNVPSGIGDLFNLERQTLGQEQTGQSDEDLTGKARKLSNEAVENPAPSPGSDSEGDISSLVNGFLTKAIASYFTGGT